MVTLIFNILGYATILAAFFVAIVNTWKFFTLKKSKTCHDCHSEGCTIK
jgi:hypothetical protein